MKFSEISKHRLLNQQILQSRFSSVKEIVHYMGGMQAQDYNMAKWGIGLRIPGSRDEMIEAAINKSEIIRTHVLRPTWHFVSAENIRWMLGLTAPRILKLITPQSKQLGIDDATIKKLNKIIEKILKGKRLTRDEIMTELRKAGIDTSGLRSMHIMFFAELNQLVCNGPIRGKQFTYALMDEVVPAAKPLKADEALGRLAEIYFTSHGPATAHDFSWWSGLTLGEVKKGINDIKSGLKYEVIEGKEYYFVNENKTGDIDFSGHLFLPAFDEFLVSYKDRTAKLDEKYFYEVITKNGIFKPIVVADGKVKGYWKRSIKNKVFTAEVNYFSGKDKLKIKALKEALSSYQNFMGMEMQLL